MGSDAGLYEKLLPALEKDPGLVYSGPSYLEIEPISECEYKCDFCPRQFTEVAANQLSLADIKLVTDFLANSLDDATVTLGGMGEPLQHDDILSICEKFLEAEPLKQLIIETNGFYLNKLERLIEHKSFAKVTIIINFNSLENSSTIHGCPAENLAKVKANLSSWSNQLKKRDEKLLKRTYLQVLKVLENETEVDLLYDLADGLGFSFLLQKYNRYIDLMPERRVSDMTPLERYFCWHLRRDMFIRADGDVSFCKQDISNQAPRGNIRSQSLAEIWQKGEIFFKDNLQNKLAKSPDCANCDEYFTFNF